VLWITQTTTGLILTKITRNSIVIKKIIMNTSTICRALAVLLCCLACAYTYAQDRPEYVRGQVLIKMKADKTAAQKSTLKTQMRVTKQRSLKNDIEVWHIDETNGEVDIKQLVEQYRNHEDVEFVEPNYYYYLADADYDAECMEDTQNVTPNDSEYGLQWGLHNTGQTGGTNDADIDALEGWDIATGSPSIRVALLDSGMDWAHQDLAENVWQNLGEDADGDGKVLEYSYGEWIFDPGDDNGVDDDGNGYVDDFVGWDFVHNDNNPYDTNGHGTHVAGILGAKGNNDMGISGVTWDVQMMPIRIFGRYRTQGAPVDSIISAINYAVNMGATISNNSWGGGTYSLAMEEAIQNAANFGHLFIAAAGNDGLDNDQYPYYPATYDSDNIISVAAIDKNDQLPSFSHYGATTVHVAAPGVAIWSSTPADGYEYRLGTSMATPHVSGAVALLWGLHYNRSYLEVKDAIINSAETTVPLVGKCVANGRLNLYDALSYFGTPPPPLNPCRQRDSLALVAIYNANGGNLTWDLTQPMSTWETITLNNEGCVTRIENYFYDYYYLPTENYDMNILPPEIGDLTNLEFLAIEGYSINNIPPEIGNLNNLKILKLEDNIITTLPPEIGNLPNLTRLDLEYNNITILPAEIGNLQSLGSLELGYNSVTSLPPEIGNLANLKNLYLPGNQITNLPPTFGDLDNLKNLYLWYNQLTIFPVEICDLFNLENLYISSNQITTFPPEIENLNNLKRLYAQNNQITNLPPEIGEPNKLEYLYLGNNQLTNLPEEIGDLKKLKRLDVNNNQLTNIPLGIGGLYNLEYLYAWSNQITSIPSIIEDLTNLEGLSLSGNQITSIPETIVNLYNLKHLHLYNNQITGGIPKEIGDLSNLERLDIRNNQMSGCYPPELINICSQLTTPSSYIESGNMFDTLWSDFCNTGAGVCGVATCRQSDSLSLVALYNAAGGASWLNEWNLNESMDNWYGVTLNVLGCVTELDLLSNNLIGTIPPDIGDLDLSKLDLSNNFLSGTIPSSIGNMSRLTTLDLWRNQLSGNIPPELGELDKLTKLNFSDNSLEGSIPSELSKLFRLTTLDLSDNSLTGEIPFELGELSALTNLYLSDNQLSGIIPYTFEVLSFLDRMWLFNNQLSGCLSDNLSVLCNRINPAFNTNYYITNGNSFDMPWEDFCASASGTCETVWPGDFNHDGKADEEDALSWGLAYNSTGPERRWLRQGTSTIVWTQGTPTTEWKGQTASNWSQNVQGVNGKHQDGDGNGIVDDKDLEVLELNFNKVHQFGQPPFINSTIIYRLERNGSASGNAVYDLYVEDGTAIPVEAHGVALTVDFGVLPVNDVEIDTTNSSLSPSDEFLIFNETENRVHIALTRTDGMNQICDTPVAKFIIITNDIPTDSTKYELRVENGSKIVADGTMEDIVGTSTFDTPQDAPFGTEVGEFRATASVLHAQCTTYGMAWVTATGGDGNYTYQWSTGETTERIIDITAGIYEVTVTDSGANSGTFTFTITVEGQYLPIYDENGNLIDCIDSTCPTLLTPGGTIPEGLYQADRTINSDGTLTGDTNYKAGETIIFGNGFEIPPGTEFSGTIEDCGGN